MPLGIAVEEFTDGDGIQDLVQICPEAVRELLLKYELIPLYDKLMKKASKCNKEIHGRKVWLIPKLVSVLQGFHDSFQEKGIRLALCIFATPCGTYRWLW